MLATLALATALSLTPAQDSQLKLSNPRATYGFLGPARESNKFLPGDVLFLAYSIDGMSVDKTGQIKYSLALEMNDSAGKKVFGQQPQIIESANSLGGNSLPGYAYANIGGDVAAGKYTIKVTVKDESIDKSQSLTHSFEVLKKDFGIGRVGLFYDERGQNWASPVFVIGQRAWLHFITMGFDRAAGVPNVEVRMRVLDESGKPTVSKPIAGDLKNQKVDPNKFAVPWFMPIELNRAGKYKIELEAEDKVAKKTVKEVLNITVLDPK
jgi:hypothetical protein